MPSAALLPSAAGLLVELVFVGSVFPAQAVEMAGVVHLLCLREQPLWVKQGEGGREDAESVAGWAGWAGSS